ncbi:MAG: FAD-dependent thymidylate synthase [Oscillospiraceae bacterium]|jgi:thymidylate synthase (FAD)|nr:FAD-dependent thymidylate synthase [Oscillospiraceae bacterium]
MAHVELLAYTQFPEETVAAAARLCYSPAGIDEIRQGMTEERVSHFMDMLTENGHETPIEHASFTFGIEGVSRSLMAQITRHRIASFSVQSQRYVAEKQFTYVMPPEIEAIPEAKEEFLQAMEEDQRHYDHLTERLKQNHKAELLKQGLSEKAADRKAEKQAIEDARFVLPNACTTKMVCTMDARSLLHFFSLRCCNRAQWEIRGVAEQMLVLAQKAAPHLFAKAGPGCLCGPCPEGKMCCGKMEDVRRHYAELSGENNG